MERKYVVVVRGKYSEKVQRLVCIVCVYVQNTGTRRKEVSKRPQWMGMISAKYKDLRSVLRAA